MTKPGNRETSGRILSTADLAAAARRPDSVADGNAEPALNEERMQSIPDRQNEITGHTLDVTETQPRHSRRNSELTDASVTDELSAEREVDASADNTGASRAERTTQTRPAQEGDARRPGSVVSERPSPSTGHAPAESGSYSREALEPLFTPELAETYRLRWVAIQSGFVDDPRRAVRSGDELVAQIMTNLANTFAEERHRAEAQLDDSGESSTENLRVALRRYRSFFERLLSL